MALTTANLFTGDHVRLTAITEDDLPVISRWYDDTVFQRNFDSNPSMPRVFDSGWLQRLRDNKRNYDFALRRIDAPEIIGLIGLDGVQPSHGVAYVGIGIGDPANQGKGYGKEGMQLLTRWAFNELNLRRLCLTVFSYNTAAIALYESLGWTREGTAREHLIRDGQPHDMYHYGLLAREWRESQ